MALGVLAALRQRKANHTERDACIRGALQKYEPLGLEQMDKKGLQKFLTDYEQGEKPVRDEVRWVMHNADLVDGKLTVWGASSRQGLTGQEQHRVKVIPSRDAHEQQRAAVQWQERQRAATRA